MHNIVEFKQTFRLRPKEKMLIKCPKCHSVYDIPDNLITDTGLAMRCAECKEIWTAYPQDGLKKLKSSSNKDLSKMFERVSKETENLFHETEVKTVEKIKVVNITRYKHTINIVMLLIVLCSLAAMLYYMRYDVVRFIPEAEKLYDKIPVESVPYGRNLEFKDIVTTDITENNFAKIEIKGKIVNTGKYITEIPPVKVDIYDKSGKLLLSTTHYLPIPRLEAGYNLLFNIVVPDPTPFGKSIYLKFNDEI